MNLRQEFKPTILLLYKIYRTLHPILSSSFTQIRVTGTSSNIQTLMKAAQLYMSEITRIIDTSLISKGRFGLALWSSEIWIYTFSSYKPPGIVEKNEGI